MSAGPGREQIAGDGQNDQREAAPGPRAHDDLIAFSSDRDGDYDIYLVRPDGSARTKLFDSEVDEWDAAWSPDGRWLAFIQGQWSSYEGDLYVVRWDGRRLRRLISDPGDVDSPAWLSNTRLLFSRGAHTYSIGSRGGGEKLIRERAVTPDFCARSESLAYARPFTPVVERQRIWIASTHEGEARPLTDGTYQGDELDPVWSPDCSAVAFWGINQSFSAEVFVSGLDGEAGFVVPGFTPDWSPDGRWIVYRTSDLGLVRPDGSDRRTIMEAVSDERIEDPAWRPHPSPAKA